MLSSCIESGNVVLSHTRYYLKLPEELSEPVGQAKILACRSEENPCDFLCTSRRYQHEYDVTRFQRLKYLQLDGNEYHIMNHTYFSIIEEKLFDFR